jgi:hypothetical protein
VDSYSKLGISVLIIGSAIVAGLANSDAAAAAPPKDPCTLLKPADIQTLAPTAKISNGVVTENGPLGGTCKYSWGPRTNEWGDSAVTVTVVDASKAWPGGLSPDVIKRRILGDMKTGGPEAAEIPGIGDGAVFTTEPKSYNAAAKAYFVKTKGVLLELKFHGGNALAQKDKLITLLKTAAAAL